MKRIHVKSISIYILSAIALCSCLSCMEMNRTYSMVAPGTWRGLLDIRDQATLPPHPEHTDTNTEFDFSETPSGVLPFNFEVKYLTPDSMQFILINGNERIPVTNYAYKANVQGETGEIYLYFPVYDTHIEARVEAGVMEGNWHVDYKKNYSVPFKAYLGQNFRFTDLNDAPSADIAGRWAMSFSSDTPDSFLAVGEFRQHGTDLLGSVTTETGDYGYASGNVSGDEIHLSSFNGSQAYLYEGKIINPDSILGAFYSGNHFRTTWEGHRNSKVTLQAPESLSKAISKKSVSWKSESTTGEIIDFDKPPYRRKIKILEIMGSWCPNCHDEARFLKEWKEENQELPIQIISLAFERYDDRAKSLQVIKEFQNKLEINWPVVYGGTIQSLNDSKLTAAIDEIRAFPTLIVFDSSNTVRYVHTGFYGPATSEYKGFKKEFDELIRQLSKEG